MKRVLVLQHEPSDDLRQWRPLFKRLGASMRFADFSRKPAARPGLGGIDGLIVLGGAMNVHEARRRKHLGHEMELVRQAAAKGLPVLAICLGSQLAAKALGGKVVKSRRPEIGWFRLASGFGRARVFQWHGYEFTRPEGAQRLAASAACADQAFSLGSVTAVQFHPEADRRMIEDWLGQTSSMPARQKQRIRRDTAACLPDSRKLGRRLFTSFLRSL